ncbi:MAG: Hpt domain-containing protein [Pirellulales bacterium]|nr:Hpt domain-containing protein [Pirellulales bacterium]
MLQEKTHEECIYSRLGGDPDLADILELFVEEMPTRVEKLLRHLDDENWDELRRTAHQLKGAAGSYGFEPLSPAANKVERFIREHQPEQQIRNSVKELVELCGRVRSGTPQ